MNTDTLRLLVAKGLSAEDILEIAETLDKKPARSVNAERQARFRAKRRNGSVTSNVTGNALPPPIEDHTPPVSSGEETSRARKAKGSCPAKPDGVRDQVWSDFLSHRKAGKAPVSETVIDGIRREAEKAGWTLDAALSELVSRGWRGFKASWVADDARPPGKPANDSYFDTLLAKQPERASQ